MDLDHMSLRLLRFAAEDSTYRSVLQAIAEALRDADARIDEALRSADQEWQEVVVDEECALDEHLLGAAFVICQAQITAVVSRAQNTRKHVLSRGGTFSAFGESKEAVRDLGARLPPPATATRVEMLWALANYFKHREEWPRDWSKINKPDTKKTVDVIKQAGLSWQSSGNLRAASEYLGNSGDYAKVQSFADIVDAWANVVVEAVKAELGVK